VILRARSISCEKVVGGGIQVPGELGWELVLAVWVSFPVAVLLVALVPSEFPVTVVPFVPPSAVWVLVTWSAGGVSP
jgi:hypothetical protein